MHIEAVHRHQVHVKNVIGCLRDILRKDVRVVHKQRGDLPAAIVDEVLDVLGLARRYFQVLYDVNVVLSKFDGQALDEAVDPQRVLEVVVPGLDAARAVRLPAREEDGRPPRRVPRPPRTLLRPRPAGEVVI